MRLIPCLAFFLCLCFPGMGMAAPLPAELAHALNQLAGGGGFSSQFEQTIRFSDGTMQAYKGELAVLQPGRFRWRYTDPYEQLFVSDGHTIWHYEPDLMQVQVLKTMQGVDPAVMRLLDGSLGLKNVILLETENKVDGIPLRYRVRIGEKKEVWLGLASRKGNRLFSSGRSGELRSKRVSPGGKSKTVYFLSYVESMDALGNYNRIRLLHMAKHPPAAASFVFRIPAGVDVLPLE